VQLQDSPLLVLRFGLKRLRVNGTNHCEATTFGPQGADDGARSAIEGLYCPGKEHYEGEEDEIGSNEHTTPPAGTSAEWVEDRQNFAHETVR
jgi:hypothetical protein